MDVEESEIVKKSNNLLWENVGVYLEKAVLFEMVKPAFDSLSSDDCPSGGRLVRSFRATEVIPGVKIIKNSTFFTKKAVKTIKLI